MPLVSEANLPSVERKKLIVSILLIKSQVSMEGHSPGKNSSLV